MAGMTTPAQEQRVSSGRGCLARPNRSRGLGVVIPAKAGGQASRDGRGPPGRSCPARNGRGDPTWQA